MPTAYLTAAAVRAASRVALYMLIAAGLAACASNVRTTALVPEATPQSLAEEDGPLFNNVSVGRVDGGAQDALIGGVSSDDLRDALTNSLSLSSMLGQSDATLTVDATLETLDQPQLALNLEVTSTIFYRVISTRTGAIVFQDRVVSTAVTEVTESLVRSERQRLANEASVKQNIRTFLERLNAAAKAEPYKFI